MPTINGRACIVNGTPVDKVFSDGRQVYGRNLALGTAKPFTVYGNGSDSSNYMYHLSSKIANGTTITMDFDITSTNATGRCTIQFVGGSYQGTDWYQIVSGTKHYSYTAVVNNDYSNGVQIRIINSTGTVTVSNFIISESSTELPWTPAPEDVM